MVERRSQFHTEVTIRDTLLCINSILYNSKSVIVALRSLSFDVISDIESDLCHSQTLIVKLFEICRLVV